MVKSLAKLYGTAFPDLKYLHAKNKAKKGTRVS